MTKSKSSLISLTRRLLKFTMRDGEIHLGYLTGIRCGHYCINDILDEEEMRLRREDIEKIGGAT